jgi:hypothetical protein
MLKSSIALVAVLAAASCLAPGQRAVAAESMSPSAFHINMENPVSAGQAATTTPDINQHGLSGSWYEYATSGQGFEIEIFPDLPAPGSGFVFVSWFTFAASAAGGADHQRWYTLSGSLSAGTSSAQLAIAQNTGGNFDALPVTHSVQVGTATLSFSSCTQGTLDYAFTDGSGRHGSIPITRITQNVTCVMQGAPATNADFALSGNWYAQEHSGQGFTVEINPLEKFAFVAWYTYAPDGATHGESGQRWYTLQSAYTPGTRTMPLVIGETTGGVFDTPTAPSQNTKAVGTATLVFQSCSAATLAYAFTDGSSAGKSGNIALTRVVAVPPGCASSESSAAQGYWTGANGSETFQDVVLDDGSYYLIYSTAGVASDVIQGNSRVENSTVISSNGVDYPIPARNETNQAGINATLSGIVVPKHTLQLNIGRHDKSETLSATYDVRYEQPASLAAAAGSYHGYTGHSGGRLPTTFSLDTDGNLSGSNVACKYAGTITPHKSTNVFDFVIHSTSGLCIFGVGPISGILLYDPGAQQVSGFATYASHSDQFFVMGAR